MPDRYTNTLMFLTREMDEEASIQQRLDNLHNIWGKEGFTESKKGNCHGCGAFLTERFYLDHEETGERCYIGSSCVELFHHTAPKFYESMSGQIDESKARQRVFNRKIPQWALELPGIPLTNYRSVHRAIQNKTKSYVNDAGYPQDMTKLIKAMVNMLPEADKRFLI
jgi:hypothetical protein